jgi:sigma-B regulation protein RsbU (phosphoserine phosphatase)
MRISGFRAPGWQGSNRLQTFSTAIPDLSRGDGQAVKSCDLTSAIGGLDIFVDSRPSLEVGGDYYDLIYQPSGRLTFSVVDISGKGLSAALVMPQMHRALRRSLQSPGSSAPHALLTQLNDDIFSLFTDAGCFATAFLGCFDPTTSTVAYVNAGHSPVIYRDAAGKASLLPADSVPLGIERHIAAADRLIKLSPGDLLVVGTDGLAEAKNSRGQMFGYQRFIMLVDSLAHMDARAIADRVFQEVASFTGSALQSDDRTLLVLRGID